MKPEANASKTLAKGVSASMAEGIAKAEASFKLPAFKQTPEAIKNLERQERVLQFQIDYLKMQEGHVGKADRLVEKQIRQTKFMRKVLGEEKNNITIKVINSTLTFNQVKIFNIQGELLKEEICDYCLEKSIDIVQQPNGTYIIQLLRNGEQIATNKFMMSY